MLSICRPVSHLWVPAASLRSPASLHPLPAAAVRQLYRRSPYKMQEPAAELPPAKRRKLEPAAAQATPTTQTAVPAKAATPRPKSAPAGFGAQSKVKPAPAVPPESDGPWLIVGLGNPGPNYEKTRHNVGFMVIDELARSNGIDCKKLEKSAAFGKGEICGKVVYLAKPVTFMNNSGESVSALAKFYKVPTSRVLVISDDLDIPTAAVRLKQKGGHGGHNGLRSIIDRFGGSHDFPRLKVGIGRPANPNIPTATYVLQEFTKAEKQEIDVAVQESIAVIKTILSLGLEKALSGVRA